MALRVVLFVGCLRAKVSAYANDITAFVSRRLDIKTVKKAVKSKEEIASAKINFDKNEGLRTRVGEVLDVKLSRAVEKEESRAIDLARRDIEHEASEHYKGYVVRSKLKRVPNEVVKCNPLAREEEIRGFPHRDIVHQVCTWARVTVVS